MAELPKFTEAEEYLFRTFVEHSRSDMAHSVKRDAEILALRAAVLKLAELNPQLDRKGFAGWIAELEKQFQQELLTAVEDKHPWMASVLDDRKLGDV